MATVSESEAKNKFEEFLGRVAEGEEIVITRNKMPVARLVAMDQPTLSEVRQAAEGLKALQKEIAASSLDKRRVSWEEFKSFIREDC